MNPFVKEIYCFLKDLPKVKNCRIYGSLSSGKQDEFSDMDVEIDVSGIDNGVFLTRLPELFGEKSVYGH